MEIGKLTNETLQKILFDKITHFNKEVLIGSGIGKDTSVLDFEGDLFVLSTDPITGSKNKIGTLCINISLNDIATNMAKPIAVMVTMLIPPYASLEDTEEIIDEILDTCKKNNVDLIGGHTEVTDSVNRFVLSCVCIGKKDKKEETLPKANDIIVMSKYAGLEGTAIAAFDFEEKLKNVFNEKELKFAKELINETTVVKESIIAGKYNVSLMHDATEGGVYGAVWEMVTNAGFGAKIYKDKIPVLNETKIISEVFNINPYKLISSGVMLFLTSDAKKLISSLEKEGIKASEIGVLNDSDEILLVDSNGKESILTPPKQDEIYNMK